MAVAAAVAMATVTAVAMAAVTAVAATTTAAAKHLAGPPHHGEVLGVD